MVRYINYYKFLIFRRLVENIIEFIIISIIANAKFRINISVEFFTDMCETEKFK